MLRRIISSAAKAILTELAKDPTRPTLETPRPAMPRQERRPTQEATAVVVYSPPEPDDYVSTPADYTVDDEEATLADEIDDDSGFVYDYSAPSMTAPTRHDILIHLGLTPFERPAYREQVSVVNHENGEVSFTETKNVAVGHDGKPVLFDDPEFANYLRTKRVEFYSLGGNGATLTFDVETQLPVITDSNGVLYAPAVSRRGDAKSWGGSTVTTLDIEMAKLGWVRYFASGGGDRNSPEMGAGTYYEGYVPILARSVKPKPALEAAIKNGCRVLLSPRDSVNGKVLFCGRPAPWILTAVQPQLRQKLEEARGYDG